MAEQYADIIIDISHEKVDRPFQYRIPAELAGAVYPGVRVHVPFGRGNQDKVGYVVGSFRAAGLSGGEDQGYHGCR